MTERYRFFCGIGAALLPLLYVELFKEMDEYHTTFPIVVKMTCIFLMCALPAVFVICIGLGLTKKLSGGASGGKG